MEFRRIETRKVLRYREQISEDAETKKILEELMKSSIEFSVKLNDMGGMLGRCVVLSVHDKDVALFSNHPRKLAVTPAFSEIEKIEVESNCDFIAEENDDGGRWSRLM